MLAYSTVFTWVYYQYDFKCDGLSNSFPNCNSIPNDDGQASRVQEAESSLLRAQKLAPRDPLIYKYLGNVAFVIYASLKRKTNC